MSDFRQAVRALGKSPAFTIVAVLTIAVGIAANTALFSVYDRLVLNPVTIPHPASLVAIWTNNPQINLNAPAISWPRYEEIREQARSFSSIGDSAFDVSPDGRSLAFVRYERPGIGDVYVALIAGRDAHRRTNWNTEISGVAWTPDGRDLVYAVLEEPGLDPTVFRIPASGNRLDRGVRSISRDRSRAECSSVFADSRTRRAWTCRDRSRKTGSASHSARTATAGPGCGWPTATGPEFNR